MVKDLTTKRCLSDNERYADLINGAVFGVNFAVISLGIIENICRNPRQSPVARLFQNSGFWIKVWKFKI